MRSLRFLLLASLCRLLHVAAVSAYFLAFLCFCIAGTSAVAHAQTYSVLYNLGSSPGDPFSPFQMTQGRNGLLYSDAEFGGTYSNGTVFDIASNGSPVVLHSFQSSDGIYATGGLTLGTDGNFYGVTHFGGANNRGTIFRITSSGALSTLHDFTTSELPQPASVVPPVLGTDGNFYGITEDGGTLRFGSFYKISRTGQFAVIYQFDGTIANPFGLVLGTDGAFYGTSYFGLNGNSYGAIFKITAFGQLTVLHNFDGVHGSVPVSPPYQGVDGNFYGTTLYGGTGTTSPGIVYRMTPSGNFTVLHEMDGYSEGSYPSAGLIQGSDGNFYGANSTGGIVPSACADLGGCGTLFRITPQGAFTVLYDFDYVSGETPQTSMVQHTNGLIYGSTTNGGSGTGGPNCSSNCGVFYSLNAGLPPFVTLSPFFGKPGSAVVILGQGFNAAMSVTFNNVAASYTLVSSTCVIATVPAQASTGRVKVSISKANALVSNRNFIVN